MSQPMPPISPGQPVPPPGPAPVRQGKGKSRTTIIALSVIGGLLTVCCLGGIVVAAVNAGNDAPDARSRIPDGLVATPGQPPDQGQPVSEPPSEPTEALPPGTITDRGTLLVGTELPPGTYRGVGCSYWERLKDADGDLDSIIANGNAGAEEHVTVTILPSDYAFENSCTALLPIEHLRTVPVSNTTSEEFGILVVGKDIHPGTWRGTATGDCYWARLSGFTGDFDSIIANDNVDAGAKFTINVRDTDKGLELQSDCGPMTKA